MIRAVGDRRLQQQRGISIDAGGPHRVARESRSAPSRSSTATRASPRRRASPRVHAAPARGRRRGEIVLHDRRRLHVVDSGAYSSSRGRSCCRAACCTRPVRTGAVTRAQASGRDESSAARSRSRIRRRRHTFRRERQIEARDPSRRDPLALRKRLALRKGDTTSTGQVLGASVGTDEVIRNDRTRRGCAAGARRRGTWLAAWSSIFTAPAGRRAATRRQGDARRATAGRFAVLSSSTDIGKGTITIFTQIASQSLGVGIRRNPTWSIRRPTTMPDNGPTVTGRCVHGRRRLDRRPATSSASTSPRTTACAR